MILSSFILFFSLVPVFESGLNRHDFVVGAVLFFLSSVFFWFCSIILDGLEEKTDAKKISKGSFDLFFKIGMVLIIVWFILMLISFYFFVISVEV